MKPMAGREKQFDQGVALNNALNIFWAKGFEATSMQELVDAMGVNRASMYQTYGNKSELFNAAIDQYISHSLDYIKDMLEASGSPLANLKQLFIQLVEQSLATNMSGCFIGNTAAELGPHDSVVAAKVRYFWEQFEALFSTALQRAIEHGELPRKANTQKLAALINSTLQGLIIKTKANIDKDKLRDDIDLLFSLINFRFE
ncbi:hypothetical protein MNBD_GAMMA23-495 [hydrothermal vent metagenome]|uniref:HTH tetR-type domain-containing protein n=1 Tax=hydrothermal vent metagenome TaxID=652676 RepID=A0A3B0ZNF1_9ZZZZ